MFNTLEFVSLSNTYFSGRIDIEYSTPFTQSKNYLDCNLDCDPEDVPVYTGHPLFNTTKLIMLLFIVYCYIEIHLISGLKLSKSQSRSIVIMGQNLIITSVCIFLK